MEYKVSDIQIAALLLAEGIQFLRLESLNPKRKTFVFKHEESIAGLVSQFWLGEAHICPRKYMGAFKTLKNELYR